MPFLASLRGMLKQDKDATDVLCFGMSYIYPILTSKVVPTTPFLLCRLTYCIYLLYIVYARPPGHVVYEMAMGYELAVSKPDVSHLVGRCPPEVVEVRGVVRSAVLGLYSFNLLMGLSFSLSLKKEIFP